MRPTTPHLPIPIEILLIEDNPGDLKLITKFFAKAKIANALETVETEQEALDYLRGRGKYAQKIKPDLILLNPNLRASSNLIRSIREYEDLKFIPIIGLVASDTEEDMLRSHRFSVDAYLRKPFELQQFVEMITSFEMLWTAIVKR